MKLGYWNLRGRAAPIRLMLEYKGLKYENKTYEITLTPEGPNMAEWTKDKTSLGLQFPNLPYLIDGDNILTESWAIYRYIGRKLDLMPQTEKAMYECDMIAGIVVDLTMNMGIAYSPDIKEKLAPTREKQLVKIQQIESFLTGRKYIAGDRLTFIDFLFYEIIDWNRLLFPDILDCAPNIQGLMGRIEGLENVAAYLKSDRYKKFPIFAPMAAWGGKDHDDRTW